MAGSIIIFMIGRISFFLFPILFYSCSIGSSKDGIPLTSYGKPDLSGVWQAMNSAHYDLEAHRARAAMALRPGPHGPLPDRKVLALGAVGAVPAGLGVVEGGQIPYKQSLLATREENRKFWLERDPEIKCYLPGVPRANYMPFPFQIFQEEESMVFVYEYAGAVRNIFLKDPGPAPLNSWMGQSVGRWENNVFVVEVTAQNDKTWFDRSGNFHSDQLKVTERYEMLNPYTIAYEALIDDPVVFERPWKIKLNLYKRQGRDAQLQQFLCAEFVEELLYGHLRKEPVL